ncbi:MAG: type II toxin-antitoxin system VapC family toxin [Caldilinea sp. CFX5]|nr:type II toxin-antitoxin system VapC family toxin [Caldilinea sp. CFX5]
MKYLLDTNACIRYISGRSLPLVEKLRTMPTDAIVVCSVVKAELFYGAMKSQTPELSLAKQLRFLNQFISLPFDDAAAQIFGEIRADLAKKGTPIGPYDLQIAAIAVANQVTLVTHNTAEFGRIAELQLEDWE